MKALIYKAPKELQMGDMPDPVPGTGDALVKVASVGICGSDMHGFLGHDPRRAPPLILGHEVAGLASGDGFADRRVTVNPLVASPTSRATLAGQDNICPHRQLLSIPPRHGGFAEMVAIPETNLVTVPDHVSLDQAALTEPIACGWHAVRIARAHPAGAEGAKALVIGGGAIGVGAALCLRANGITDILVSEPNSIRRDYIEAKCGLSAVSPEDVPSDGDYDVVIDGVGYAPTRAQACEVVRPGGIIVHIGLGSGEGGVDSRRLTLWEITFVGTYSYTAQDFRDTAQAMFDGRLGALDWIETRPLSEGARAFEDIRAGRVTAPKIILKPDS